MEWLISHPERRLILQSATVGAVVMAIVLFLLWLAFAAPSWRASGDGKTIFNARTGELRYTASGRSVAEVMAENQQQLLEQAASDAESEEIAKQVRKEAEFAAQNSNYVRHARNSRIYYNVKKFVDDHPTVIIPPDTTNFAWELRTKPFRTGVMLDQFYHQELLDFLGLAIKHEPYKSDPTFVEAINELRKWQFMSPFGN